MQLYHYAPKENSILKDGLLSVSRCHEKLKTYVKRAGSNEENDILKWLENSFPGRSRSVSCLTEPIRWQGNDPVLKQLVTQSELFSFNLDALILDGLVESVWLKKGSKTHGEDEIFEKIAPSQVDVSPLAWEKVDSSKGLIYGVIRHYLIVLKKGIIPPAYLKKE